jgi:hypothetical protein
VLHSDNEQKVFKLFNLEDESSKLENSKKNTIYYESVPTIKLCEMNSNDIINKINKVEKVYSNDSDNLSVKKLDVISSQKMVKNLGKYFHERAKSQELIHTSDDMSHFKRRNSSICQPSIY